MKHLFKLILSLGLLFSSAASAHAAERIINFDSNIFIDKQNVADITETIQYDFGSDDRHGIYRYVPVDYTDDKNNTYHLALTYLETKDENGRKVQSENSKSNGNFTMRLGDPDTTITGIHTYKIHYQLRPIVRQEGERGFLALDITGDGWEVPIERASASFRFEDSVSLADGKCFSGPPGSTAGCLVQESFPATYVAQNLNPHEGMTVQGLLPAGYVANYLVAGKRAPLTAEDIQTFFFIGLAVLSGLFVGWIFLMRYLRERRRKKAQTIVAQYEPPAALSPGEIGLLQDDVSGIREITAMLIDLSVRGFMKIEQTSPKKWYKKAKYTLRKVKEPTGLVSYEQKLWNQLFSGRESIELERINKATMSAAITQIHADLKSRLKKKGFYGSLSSEPGMMEKLIDTGNITDAGAVEWAKVEGLRLYLKVAEKDRLNFTDAPQRTPERFNKLLPYAVALGVEKEWAKLFAGIDMQRSSGWYVGSYPHFSSSALASDLGGSFSSSFSSNATMSSSSSGGSSGGGSGGGGGGSW
ncbi:MAG TPA: DUF2207 domain-containing protein [Candidatus Saccharimonadia bacterium]